MQLSVFPKTVYLMSGGKSSTLAAYYHRALNPEREYIYYFNDTLFEDRSTYRFLVDSLYFLEGKKISSAVARKVLQIPEISWNKDPTLEKRKTHLDDLFDRVCRDTGLHRERSINPWDSFAAERYIGNTRVDVCSRLLKRDPRRRFTDSIEGGSEICIGFHWSEIDRFEKALQHESNLIAPLASDFVDTQKLWAEFQSKSGIDESISYKLGLPHDNCSGACVKSGLSQWRLVWEKRPHVYEWCENRMEQLMSENPSLKPFLRKTIDGVQRYLTLKQYRTEFLEDREVIDDRDFLGCECAI